MNKKQIKWILIFLFICFISWFLNWIVKKQDDNLLIEKLTNKIYRLENEKQANIEKLCSKNCEWYISLYWKCKEDCRNNLTF